MSSALVPRRARCRQGGGASKTGKCVILFLICHILRTMYHRRRIPRALPGDGRPFVAFTGAGLFWAYYHGIVTYIRDHFYVDDLRLSAISGGCIASLGLVMGLDLYQIAIMGLHMRRKVMKEGVYLYSCAELANLFYEHLELIGLTDLDTQRLSARQQLYVGVTQCFPPRHCSINCPPTLRELVDVWVCSMCVPPFLRSPGTFRGTSYVDGGFSAIWSIPEGQSWADVIKITCLPAWCTLCPPALAAAEVQPTGLWLSSIFYPHAWTHQRQLIKLGYEDAKRNDQRFRAGGLRPLPEAPLTPWRAWEQLFESTSEDNLPPVSNSRCTVAMSDIEKTHEELLRTHSSSNLVSMLPTQRQRRISRNGSQSHDSIIRIAKAAGSR